jgi:lysophospholipase L1-like esterase
MVEMFGYCILKNKLIKNITVFGDSISFGQGVALIESWVALMNSRFPSVMWTNCSVNGNTTRQALDRFPYEVQNKKCDLLIIAFGLNDANYWETDQGLPRVSKSSFRSNCKELAIRAKHFGINNIFFLTNHPTNKGLLIHGKYNYEANYLEYLKVLRNLKNELDFIEIIDTFETFDRKIENLSDLLLEDGIHLSKKGHEIYFETISKSLSEKLLP